MSLAPYPRSVARIAPAAPMRWEDLPSGAIRQVGIDIARWEAAVTGDPATGISASVTPSDGGLAISGAAVADGLAGVTLEATAGGIGTDYAVVLTVTTAGGRREPFAARVLVTNPTA